MECHFSRYRLRPNCLLAGSRHLSLSFLKTVNAIHLSYDGSKKRLHERNSSLYVTSRFRRMHLAASPVLSARNNVLLRIPQTRSIIISKVIDVFRDANVTSVDGLNKFILGSAPVSAVNSFYEWTEAITGLPWGANIILCSFVLQLIFNVPVNIYMAYWTTNKEKQAADLLAIQSSMIRSPHPKNAELFENTVKDLAKEYGCETYKVISAIVYQMVSITITSFGVRSLLVKSDPVINDSLLPWGASLGLPDSLLLLPIATTLMSLLIVEVGAWRRLYSEDGRKLSFRRASLPYRPEPPYLLTLRRFCSLPFIIIYCLVPSALTLHWSVIMFTSLNTQILMAHRQTRRTFHVPSSYYETDTPYRDFFNYLKYDCTMFRKRA